MRLTLVAFVMLLAAGPATAAIEVIEDEVIFTIEAPGASNVFLVGDFNNWNPTLEKMDKIGDTFQSLLFLAPGVYHYKFIVDGEWVFDPDNEYHDEDKGSLVAFEDRGGLIVVATEDYLSRTRPRSVFKPGIRYAGRFGSDDGDTSSDQRVDVYVEYMRDRMRARGNIKTVEDEWQLSPLESGLTFDRGFLEASVGKALLQGFENDSLWTSSDPFDLVGRVGVFDYNAGFSRKGIAVQLLDVAKTNLRAMIVDKLDTYPNRPVGVPADAFGDFATSTGSDTTVYRYLDSADDGDTWAMEFVIDLDQWAVGYGTRRNRGWRTGLLVDAERVVAGFDIDATTTRESWDADLVWGRWRFMRDLEAEAGYAYSSAHVTTGARSGTTVAALGDVAIGQDTESADVKLRFQTSRRGYGRLAWERDGIDVGLDYMWTRFDFEPSIYGDSQANVNVYRLAGGYARGRWRAGADLRYLDQRYGNTPGALHYFTPARNSWIDYDHKLDPANMVVFDLTRSTVLGADFVYNERRPFGWREAERRASLTGMVRVEAVFADLAGRFEHASLVAGAEREISHRVYGQIDGRVSHYNKSSWDISKTYFAPYLEVGYRHKHVEASIGFGQDPVVLDPVVNQYYRIGRIDRLRRAAYPGVTRGDAAELGARLQEAERLLEKDRTVKLEVIVLF